MSQFDDLAADLCADPLAEFFGEQAYYRTAAGVTIDLSDAIVDREPLAPQASDYGARLTYDVVVRVRRSRVPVITKGADTIRITLRKGDQSLTQFTVTQLLGQDGGFWVLGLN